MGAILSNADLTGLRTFYSQSMVSMITLERWTGTVDQFDKKTYGAAEAIPAKVNETSQQIYNAAGELTVAVAKIMVPYDTGVTTDDQVTLPGASKPAVLLSAGQFPSDSWPLTQELLVGKA